MPVRDRAEYMRNYRLTHPQKDYHDSRSAESASARLYPFVGIDGEGATKPICSAHRSAIQSAGCASDKCGPHRYVLLRAGTDYISDNSGLSTKTILDWLTQLPGKRIYVGYFFDYDTTMILRGVPWTRLAGARVPGQRTRSGGLLTSAYGMWYDNYLITYRPGAELTIDYRIRNPAYYDGAPEEIKKTIRPPDRNRIVISDTQKFFQQAFMKTIDQWECGTPEIRALIAEGKERRPLVEDLDQECIDYNGHECVLLAELMEKMRDACTDAGIVPRRWQGPGYLATAMFERNHVPRAKEYEGGWPLEVREAGRAAYYGGRFELAQIGPVPGPVIQADITSAYPYAMRDMFCPVHLSWQRTGTNPGSLALVHATVESLPYRDNGPLFCPVPHRDKHGTVCFPLVSKGWYWSFELEQARRECGMFVTVHDSWTISRECDETPWEFMTDMYAERQRVGKANKGKVLKLGMNSGYGKMAQTVGHPTYSQHVMASYITATCRTQIMKAIHACSCESGKTRCGQGVIMVATDALFVEGTSFPYPERKELGGWEYETYEDGLFCVQPGVYFKGGKYLPKTRGVPGAILNERLGDLRTEFRRMVQARNDGGGGISLDYKRFIGIREAVHRGNPRALGTFVVMGGEDGRKVNFDWKNKRHWQPIAGEFDGDHPLQTMAKYLRTDVPVDSVPYPKVIPLRENAEFMSKEMNDTPEEYPALFEIPERQS